jgi:hypothetical protein
LIESVLALCIPAEDATGSCPWDFPATEDAHKERKEGNELWELNKIQKSEQETGPRTRVSETPGELHYAW